MRTGHYVIRLRREIAFPEMGNATKSSGFNFLFRLRKHLITHDDQLSGRLLSSLSPARP